MRSLVAVQAWNRPLSASGWDEARGCTQSSMPAVLLFACAIVEAVCDLSPAVCWRAKGSRRETGVGRLARSLHHVTRAVHPSWPFKCFSASPPSSILLIHMQATMAQARRSAPAMEDWVQPLASSQPDALRGLFQACTVTRDLVLRTAGKVTVRVQLPSFKKPVSGTVLRGLSTRGRQPTQLCVEATEKASDSDVANGSVQLFAALQARGRVISALEFAPPLTRPDIAHQLAATFPALRQLTLTDLRTPLPPSELMPHLTDLDIVFADIHGDELPLWQSVAKYLPQLQRLGLYTGYDGCDGSEYCFDVLFGPDTPPTLSLTHLETQHMCRGDLVGQLLTHVPNLTHLIVGAMQVDTVEHRGQQWGVRELYCKGVQDEDDMGRVANLPRPRDGPVKLGSPYGLSMVVEREQVRTVTHTRTGTHTHTHTHLFAHAHTLGACSAKPYTDNDAICARR